MATRAPCPLSGTPCPPSPSSEARSLLSLILQFNFLESSNFTLLTKKIFGFAELRQVVGVGEHCWQGLSSSWFRYAVVFGFLRERVDYAFRILIRRRCAQGLLRVVLWFCSCIRSMKEENTQSLCISQGRGSLILVHSSSSLLLSVQIVSVL